MVGGQLTLSMGSSRAEVRSYVQRATISKKEGYSYIKQSQNNTRDNFDILYYVVCKKENTFSPLQVKNKPHNRE
jgi:hypothetical protein